MRRVRHSVAVSLDGYLAGPKGEIDWIVDDPEVDFVGFAAQSDTLVSFLNGARGRRCRSSGNACIRVPAGSRWSTRWREVQEGQAPGTPTGG
jgi:hypothetical protein